MRRRSRNPFAFPHSLGRQLPYGEPVRLSFSDSVTRPDYGLCDVLHFVGKVAAGSRRRERFAVLVAERDGIFDNLAKFRKDGPLVGAVISAVDQARRTTDIALILIGPLEKFLRIWRFPS